MRIAELARRALSLTMPLARATHAGPPDTVDRRQAGNALPQRAVATPPGQPALAAKRRKAAKLTLASLDAWAAAPGQTAQESAERAELVSRLTRPGCLGERSLYVPENLLLSRSAHLTTLPEGLRVKGNLQLSCCTALRSLPAGLHVGGNLDLSGCTSIVALPTGITVGYTLDISGCTALVALPTELTIGQSLKASDCSALARIPADMRLKYPGVINLSRCTSLVELPAGLGRANQLGLFGCTALVKLPADMHVSRDLDLSNCPALTALPKRLYVGEHFSARHCTALTQIPAPLRGGSRNRCIDFSGCTAITQLPRGFGAKGSLRMRDCTALVSLPTTFKIGGHLDLAGCAALAALPERLSVAGDVNLSRCAALTKIPKSFLRWRRLFDGGVHSIEVSGSGIPPETVAALRRDRRSGVRSTPWEAARMEHWDQALAALEELRSAPAAERAALDPATKAFLNWQPDTESIRALSHVRRRFTAHASDDTDTLLRAILCLHGPSMAWGDAASERRFPVASGATSLLEDVAAKLQGPHLAHLVLREGQTRAQHGVTLMFHTEQTRAPGKILKFAMGQVSGCITAAYKHDLAQGHGLELPTCRRVVEALKSEHGCLDARVRAVADAFAGLGIAEDVPVDVADARGQDPIADGVEHLRVFLAKQLKAFAHVYGEQPQAAIEADSRFASEFFNQATFVDHLGEQRAFPGHDAGQLRALAQQVAEIAGVFDS